MTGNMFRIPEISTIKYKYSIQQRSVRSFMETITQNILIVDAWTKLLERAVTKLEIEADKSTVFSLVTALSSR